MTKEILHQEVEKLGFKNLSTAIALHALIDLGLIEVVECQHKYCRYETRKFVPSGSKPRGRVLSIEHKVLRMHGGNHRPENIAIFHLACNSSSGNYARA